MNLSALLLVLAPSASPAPLQAAGPFAPAPPDRRLRFVATATDLPGAPAMALVETVSGRDASGLLDPRLRTTGGLRFETLDVSVRTELTEQLPLSTRLRPEGVAGLVLPFGSGTLHRYLRGTGPVHEGLLHVGPDGRPRILFELERADPLVPVMVDTVGVGPFGASVLAATTPAAGGRLVEFDLLRRRTVERGAAPEDYTGRGLHVGAAFGFAVTPTRVLRFDRASTDPASEVPLAGGGAPAFDGDAALSPRGAFGVVLGRDAAGLAVPYAFGATGPAVPTATTPLAASGDGHARDTTFGPFLVITDDGRTVAWRVDDYQDPATLNVGNEVFVQRAGLPFDPVAVSGDAFVMDTISEVGRIFSATTGGVQFFIGEPNDPTEGGIESADLFRARMEPTGAVTLENLTNTMGDPLPPFTMGVPTLIPARQVLFGASTLWIHEDDGKRLMVVDLDSGALQLLLPNVREVFWVEQLPGGAWCAAVERDTNGRERELVGAPAPTGPVSVLDAGGPATVYTARRKAGPTVACLRNDFGQEQIVAVRPGSGGVQRLPHAAGFGLPLALLDGDTVLATRRVAGGLEPIAWSLTSAAPPTTLAPPAPSVRIVR